MFSDETFEVKFELPDALEEMTDHYSTIIGVSRSHQKGVIGPIPDLKWVIWVYVITKVCMRCGQNASHIGDKHIKTCSGNCSWNLERLLLIQASEETFDKALANAENQASELLANPGAWTAYIELDLRPEQYKEWHTELDKQITELSENNDFLRREISRLAGDHVLTNPGPQSPMVSVALNRFSLSPDEKLQLARYLEYQAYKEIANGMGLSTGQAAKKLGLTARQVLNLIYRGRLPAARTDWGWRIPDKALAVFMSDAKKE